jgi:outer membrane usher protein
MHENRPVGRTNADGQLFVPGMRAWESNLLSIAAEDLPADAVVGKTVRYLRPRERAGAVVRFEAPQSTGARIRLTDGAANPLPLGTIVTLESDGSRSPVGYDGEAFLVNLQSSNNLAVQLPDGGRCRASFPFVPDPGTLPLVGPVLCR